MEGAYRFFRVMLERVSVEIKHWISSVVLLEVKHFAECVQFYTNSAGHKFIL